MSRSIMLKEDLSKKTKTFADVETKAYEIEGACQDFLVKNIASNLWANSEDCTFSWNHTANGVPETTTMPASSWALSQLSIKLGMPSGYAEKCIERKHPDLAAENLNTWLAEQGSGKKPANMLLRSYNDQLRACLSDRFTAFDTTQILDVVKRTINVDDYHIVGSYLSEERMHLRMIRDELLDVDGEDLYPGIFIDSSDVGRTAFHISFGIWKKVCTNGLCINKIGGVLYHQKHMGITSLEVETEMAARIKTIPELITRSEAVIKAARTEKIDFKDEKIFERMVNDIRRLSKVSEEDAKAVIELSQSRYGNTRWGVVNAMTEVAQKFELDDRIRIENAAGRLITM